MAEPATPYWLTPDEVELIHALIVSAHALVDEESRSDVERLALTFGVVLMDGE